MIIGGFPPTMAQVQAGKLSAIGLTTKERLPVAPNIPAIAEAPGLQAYDFPVWVGLFAPSGVPAPVLDRIHRETVAIFGTPEIRANIEKAGMTVSDESRAAFASFVKGESAKYEKVIAAAGIRVR